MIISIDPGVTHCGVSVIHERGPGKVECIATANVVGGRKLGSHLKDIVDLHGERQGKLFRICEQITKYMDDYNIKAIVIEAPFFSSRSPRAFEALLDVVHAVKYIVAIPKEMKLITLEPTLVKKVFTGKGNANKDVMEEFFDNLVDSKHIVIPPDTDGLTEHQIDSIAVGYSYFNMEAVAIQLEIDRAKVKEAKRKKRAKK